MSLNDPVYVRSQYETEHGLAARKSIYGEQTGPDARAIVFDAVAEVAPTDVLEVGCGEGELAQRLTGELGVDLVAVDQSARMVELARERGVDAHVGDVQSLPFEDGSFDVAVAAWMLYHVPDVERGVRELHRVLRPGGRLVAATNCSDHLREMLALVGISRWTLPFSGENGGAILGRVFAHVDRRPADGTVTLRDAAAIRRYLSSTERFRRYVDRVPELDAPLVARRSPIVFVAER